MDDLELDNLDAIPDSALMTPLDKMTAELPSINAEPAAPISMGAESGLLPTPAQVQPSAVPGYSELDLANAASMLDPFNASTVEQVKNMFGAQYPTDIHTGAPLAPTPLPDMSAAAGPAVIAPAEQLITQKTGDVATQTVSPTAGTMSALQGARNAVAAQDAALVEQGLIDQQLAQDKVGIDAQRELVAADYAAKAQGLYDLAEKDMQLNRDEIARLRQEYASQPWQSYWGSKDTGDKIMLGLAVGLGALAQSEIGGQNLAMAFIQSNIDDHNKSQSERFRKLEAQLNSAQSGSIQAQQAIKSQFDNLIASKAAAYDHMDKQLAAISSKTNAPSAAAKAERLRAELNLKANKELYAMENELSARTTTRSDIFNTKTVKGNPTAFVRADGQPMTEAQSKEYKAFLNSAPAIKDMETLEDQGLTNTGAFAEYRKALIGEMRELGALGGLVEGTALLAKFDSMVDRVTAGNPGLQLYNRALRKIMVDKLRLDSGASIAPSEYQSFIKTYMPADNTINLDPAHQATNLKQVRDYRRTYLDTMVGASGSSTRPWYAEGKK